MGQHSLDHAVVSVAGHHPDRHVARNLQAHTEFCAGSCRGGSIWHAHGARDDLRPRDWHHNHPGPAVLSENGGAVRACGRNTQKQKVERTKVTPDASKRTAGDDKRGSDRRCRGEVSPRTDSSILVLVETRAQVGEEPPAQIS